jgi:competence protein ComEA
MDGMDALPFAVSRRHALVVAILALAALVVASRWVGAGAARDDVAPRPLTLERAAPAARPPVVVHVVGAVRRPGLYRLKDGARVADALTRAGGATAKADLALVNLAAPVADGAQIIVPDQAPAAAPPASSEAPGASAASAAPAGPGGVVHLNTATLEQLDTLPGVGPATAQRILDYREQHGAFRSVDELDAVPGIGPARMEQLRDLVAP